MGATPTPGERGAGLDRPVGRFCRQLAEVRAGSGLNVRQVAARIHVSKTHLYDVLAGRISNPPDWDALVEPMLRTCLGADRRTDRGTDRGELTRVMALWRRRYDVLCEVHEELRTWSRPGSGTSGNPEEQAGQGLARTFPSVLRIPPRNPHFIGRTLLLEELHTLLEERQTVTVHALRGMGGVGKTQTAIEYAHRHSEHYQLVWWVDAEIGSAIGGQLGELLSALDTRSGSEPGRPQSTDLVTTLTLLGRALARVPNYLLVFDNAEDVDDLRPFLLAGPGRTLITTRRGGFRAVGSVIDVDVLDHQDAVALLRRRCPSLSEHDAGLLATRLGDLPLALDQAGAYLDRTAMSASNYLELLRTRALDLLDRGSTSNAHTSSTHTSRAGSAHASLSGSGHVGYSYTVATVWLLSMLRLVQESPAAAQLLVLAAWFAPEPIPLEVFGNGFAQLPSPLREAAQDPLDLVECVTAITDYSLARHTPSGLLVHRLIQDVARARVAQIWLDDADPRQVTIDVAAAYLSENPWGRPDIWPRYRQLLPHMLAMAEWSPGPDAHRVAPLLTRTGLYLQRQGRHTEACKIHQAAVRHWESSPDTTPAELATELHHLGRALAGRHMFTEALPLQERALQIVLAAGSPDDPQVAVALNNVGRVLAGLERHAEAVPMHRRALAIRIATAGPDHPTVATDLHFLAQALGRLDEHHEALTLHEQALRIREAAVGPDHPDVATHRRSVGRTLAALGRHSEAVPLLRQVLQAHITAYGELHGEICTDLTDIAIALRHLGKDDEAAVLLDRAIVIHDRSQPA